MEDIGCGLSWRGMGSTKTHCPRTHHMKMTATSQSSRLITIHLKASPFNVNIIQACAPKTDYDDDDIEDFYNQLQEVIDQAQKKKKKKKKKRKEKDILVVQGDWNAKIGQDASNKWTGTCGQYCNPETNERGLGLLEFATYNNLKAVNTFGSHKPSKENNNKNRRRRLPQLDRLHHGLKTLPVKCEHRKNQKLRRSRYWK